MHELNDDIADTRSLLNTSSQMTKDVKARLKELTDKKKETSKVPRNNQAASNKSNAHIPKMGAGSALTQLQPNNEVKVQEIAPIEVLVWTGVLVLPLEIGTHCDLGIRGGKVSHWI